MRNPLCRLRFLLSGRSVRLAMIGLFALLLAARLPAQSSQGVDLTHAALFGANRGSGVTVAVIDQFFGGLPQALQAGELPALTPLVCSAVTQQCQNLPNAVRTQLNHGTAAAEIVHEMAPGAQLLLLQVTNSEDLDVAVSYCRAHGVRIISHSLVYPFENFLDGACYTGHCANGACGVRTSVCAVNTAAANNILFVTGVGNDGDKSIEGVFTDATGPQGIPDSIHDERYEISLAASEALSATLAWNEFPATSTDFDFNILNAAGMIVQSNRTGAREGAPQRPRIQTVTGIAPGTYFLEIRRRAGTTTPRFKIRVEAGTLSNPMPYGSLATPADAVGAVSVGAIDQAVYPFWNAEPVALSSRGPVSLPVPRVEPTPTLTAPTDVSSFASEGHVFSGTSAATPHAAGAAAVLLACRPQLTRDQLYAVLRANTTDLGVAGPDNDFGYGRLDLAACSAAAPVLSAPASLTTGTPYSVSWTSCPYGRYELQESTDAAFTAPRPPYVVDGSSRTFTYSTASPLTYHYRVRAACDTTSLPWSNTRTVSICPGSTSTTISVASTASANSTQNRALTADPATLQRRWTISNGVITSQDPSGITFTAGAAGNVVLGVTVGTGPCARTASKTIPICTTSVAPASLSLPPNGGLRHFALTSSCAWFVRNDAPWITVYTGSSGTGNGTVSLLVAENLETYPRSASVEIGGNVITITQQGTVSRRSDFDGDAKSDHLVLDRASGQLGVRLMDGAGVTTEGWISGAPPSWRAVGTGDLNGDRRADMVWRRVGAAGAVVWLLDGTTATDGSYVTPDSDPGWIASAVADFDGDGKADILWRHATTGAFDVTLMDRFSVRVRGHLGVTTASWIIADTGDVNGDGKADVVWRNTTTGEWAIHQMNGTSVAAVQSYPAVPLSSTLAAADVDGDGKADVVWRSSSGQVRVMRMNGFLIRDDTVVFTDTDTAWPLLGTGDFNGDGMQDLFWWKTSGELRILQMQGIGSPTPLAVSGVYPNSRWVVVSPTTAQTAHQGL